MKVGFIGTGNMGAALAKAVSATGLFSVSLYDKDEAKASLLANEIGAQFSPLSCLTSECDIIFLGVKPNILPSVLKELATGLKDRCDAMLVSMAAGVSLSTIEAYLGFSFPTVRIMPNTPVAYGKGMILYTPSASVSSKQEQAFTSMLSKAGLLDKIDERLMDAASAVSGCGPAFAFMFVEALADGGVAAGLPRDKAQLYAAQMLLGSATSVLQSGIHPGALKDAVCSPGGSTIEGVMALEDGGFRGVVSDAVIASFEKTKRLGKQ